MRKSRSKMLDYLPPLVALLAAMVAVIGTPKWNEKADGLHRVTSLGWMTLAVSSLAFIATCLVTTRNNRERAQEKKTRSAIASIGKERLRQNLRHLVGPMMSEYIWRPDLPAPASAGEMLNQVRHLKLGALNLNSASPFAAGDLKEIRWFKIIEDFAHEGAAEMTATLQIFVTYLPAEIIDTATKILECDFLKMHLFHLHDLVEANTRIHKDRSVPMFMYHSEDKNMDEHGYSEFWTLYVQLESQCAEG